MVRISRLFIALWIGFVSAACASEGAVDTSFEGEPPSILIDPESGDEYELDPNRVTPSSAYEVENGIGKSVSSLIVENEDWSGQVTIQVVSCFSSAPRQHQSVACSVDSSFVVVGGGAQAFYGGGPGALLTESRPFDSNLRQWVASSKDHRAANPHELVVYAVGMKLANVSRSSLLSNMELRSDTSDPSSHPLAQVSTSEGFVAIGGGAKVHWTGVGNLLTRSSPVALIADERTWIARSKDHGAVSPAAIQAFVIGIRKSIPGFGQLELATRANTEYTPARVVGDVTVVANSGWVNACPGAYADWNPGRGRLLTGIVPDQGSGAATTAYDKDHGGDGDDGDLVAYVRQVRKRP